MLNTDLKNEVVSRILPTVRTPAQYVGGEVNSIVKDHKTTRGTVCLAFPDTYSLGMSHHGLQVLYSLMNEAGWSCERTFTPLPDFESALKREGLPLYSLETFTPLGRFDVLGFSLQYEICYTNVLTMLDLGGIALHAEDRGPDDTLVIAGGPGAQNPELLAPFIDLFVIGDGEPSLPVVCDLWKSMQGSGLSRDEKLARIAGSVEWAYVPRFYEPIYAEDGTIVEIRRTRDDVPEEIKPCVIRDLDSIPLPTRPVVPFVETAHDRIAIEIMRGCPWLCRFCQSTVIKRPLRHRTVETIVTAALASYRATGYDEISLLSLSTSDYPDFEELVTRMSEVFTPLGVKISLPSLRITETLKKIPAPSFGRAQEWLDAGPGGCARRHAAADPQADQQPGPLRRLRRGVSPRMAEGEALFHVWTAGRASRRPRRHHRDGRNDRQDRQRCDRALCRCDGQRVELHSQAAHGLSVERPPEPGLFALGASILEGEGQDPLGDGEVPRHRAEYAGGHLDSRRPQGRRRARSGLESRGAARRLVRVFQSPALVGDVRRSRNRRFLLQPPRAADRGGASLGPYPHPIWPGLPGQGAIALVRTARGNGRGGVGLSAFAGRY